MLSNKMNATRLRKLDSIITLLLSGPLSRCVLPSRPLLIKGQTESSLSADKSFVGQSQQSFKHGSHPHRFSPQNRQDGGNARIDQRYSFPLSISPPSLIQSVFVSISTYPQHGGNRPDRPLLGSHLAAANGSRALHPFHRSAHVDGKPTAHRCILSALASSWAAIALANDVCLDCHLCDFEAIAVTL